MTGSLFGLRFSVPEARLSRPQFNRCWDFEISFLSEGPGYLEFEQIYTMHTTCAARAITIFPGAMEWFDEFGSELFTKDAHRN